MKILLVEDDNSTREIARVTLAARGHDLVVTSSSGEACAALDLARKSKAPFDLIITDYGLPIDSGGWVAGYARGLEYDGPIAVMTAYSFEVVKEAIALTGAEYWPKPDALGDLAERVESIAKNLPRESRGPSS